jgi:hypothetical protein
MTSQSYNFSIPMIFLSYESKEPLVSSSMHYYYVSSSWASIFNETTQSLRLLTNSMGYVGLLALISPYAIFQLQLEFLHHYLSLSLSKRRETESERIPPQNMFTENPQF